MKHETPEFPDDIPHIDLDSKTDVIILLSLENYNITQIAMIKTHQYLMGLCSFNCAAISWVKSGYAEKFRRKYKIKTNS